MNQSSLLKQKCRAGDWLHAGQEIDIVFPFTKILMSCPIYAQDLLKICSGSDWDMSKICSRYATVVGKKMPFPKCAEGMFEICSLYVQDMLKICWRYPKDISKICSKYIKNMSKKCSNYLQYAKTVPEVCRRYAQCMLKILSRYGQDKSWISPIYAHYMSKICLRKFSCLIKWPRE